MPKNPIESKLAYLNAQKRFIQIVIAILAVISLIGYVVPELQVAQAIFVIALGTVGLGVSAIKPGETYGLVLLASSISIVGQFGWPWWSFFIVLAVLLGLSAVAMVFIASKQTGKQSTLLGSARFQALKEMLENGHVFLKGYVSKDSHGLVLGRADMSAKDAKKLDSRFRYTGHVVTCAPTGAGKGIGCVIPTLLEYPGPCFVLDVKGENWAVTHHLREEAGRKVVRIDPFGVMGESVDGYNVIDWLRRFSDDAVADASMIAEALVVSDKGESSHWDETARDLIRGLLLYAAESEEEGERSLLHVRHLLTVPLEELVEKMQDMSANGSEIVRRVANGFLALEERERSGLLSTARRHTAFLDDKRAARVLSVSTFDLAELKNGAFDVFVIMPPERMQIYSRLMRLLVSLGLTSMSRLPGKRPYNVLFLLDEFAQLGRFPLVESAISILRGYGGQLWLFVQDLSQLKGVYEKWQTFLANAAKQFFATADYDTAKYISDTMGQETLVYMTEGTSDSVSFSAMPGSPANLSEGRSESEHVQTRSLLTPDEIMAMPKDRALVMIRGERPALLTKLNYLSDPDYSPLAAPNPLHG